MDTWALLPHSWEGKGIASTEAIIQGAAALTALAALGVAVWEGMTARRHSRLSVRPYLIITEHFAGSRGRLGLTVSNEGLGPALVTGYSVHVDGRPTDEAADCWESAVESLPFPGVVNLTVIGPGGIVRAGDLVWLLWTPFTDENFKQVDRLRGSINRLGVSIRYESMYGSRDVARYGDVGSPGARGSV